MGAMSAQQQAMTRSLPRVPTTSDELPRPVQLTAGNFDNREPAWAPDGSRIYFLTRRIAEPDHELPSTDVYFVPCGAVSLRGSQRCRWRPVRGSR